MPRLDRAVVLWAILIGAAAHSEHLAAQDQTPPRAIEIKPANASGDTSPPRSLNPIEPAYPLEARTHRESGSVEITLTVDVHGLPKDIQVTKSSGRASFDQAAREAVEKATFAPAKQNGRPISTTVVIPVNFRFRRSADSPAAAGDLPPPPKLEWKRLADLPDGRGFAGQFVGVSGGRLLLYGGTNFPDKPIWEGGAKRWYRDVYALDSLDAKWRKVGALDATRAVGYGVALTTKEGILCVGGADAAKHYDDVFFLNYDGEKLTTRDLPKLPKPCAYLAGVVSPDGRSVYVAGGTEKPDAVEALRTFWMLDLVKAERWVELPAWQQEGRMLSTLGFDESRSTVVLVGGCSLARGPDDKPVRTYSDAVWSFRVNRATQWKRRGDISAAGMVASPSPPIYADKRLILFPGDDGTNIGFEPPEKHPGFSGLVLGFDYLSQSWTSLEKPPLVPVCTPVVPWQGGYVIASGEIRPSVRTVETWFVSLKTK